MPVLLYLASPRCSSLQEMRKQSLYISDIPVYDMSADYILLAEQRQAEANLKEKFEKLTVELTVRGVACVWEHRGWLGEAWPSLE